jgi:thioredoxin reductase (NADPH)
MRKPVLLAVDEHQEVLDVVERELCRRYARDYEVHCVLSGEKALSELTFLSDAGEDVALVLWGDCGYDIEESDVLERIRRLHPLAKRALMVPWLAWADPDLSGVIVRSMASGRIDYYVLRPESSPDELFHERISNFLYEWTKARDTPSYAARVVGRPWSRRSYEVRDLLQRNGLPNAFRSADSEEGRNIVASAGGDGRLPVVAFPDGRALVDPTNVELAEAFGVTVRPDGDEFDVVVVGGGPAGLSAGVYGASEGLSTLVVEEQAIGGQAGSSSLIRNYLGFPRGISGAELAGQAYQQAWIFDAKFAFMRTAARLEQDSGDLALTLSDGQRVRAGAVVLATGASYRRLRVEELERLQGAGVYYGGAAAEAQAVAGEDVYVVGGANSAGQAALHFARHARCVTLLVRAPSIRAGMSEYLACQIEATDNIRVREATTVVGGGGDGRLERLVVHDAATGEDETVPAGALFVLIGARPHTAWLPDEVARDAGGFVLTGADLPLEESGWPLERPPLLLESSLPGVFAAGDVRHGSIKRVASAVGEGSIAIQLVHSLQVTRRLGPAGAST